MEALAEQELLDQIEDLPKRAGQILTIAAMLGERLDVLLVASLLMTSPRSVEDCIWDLEKAGYLRNSSITSQFLASAVMKNVPADSRRNVEQEMDSYKKGQASRQTTTRGQRRPIVRLNDWKEVQKRSWNAGDRFSIFVDGNIGYFEVTRNRQAGDELVRSDFMAIIRGG